MWSNLAIVRWLADEAEREALKFAALAVPWKSAVESGSSCDADERIAAGRRSGHRLRRGAIPDGFKRTVLA